MGIVDTAVLLEERNPPDHVADRRRREQQAGNDPAEVGLRIAENDLEGRDQAFSCRGVGCADFPGRDQEVQRCGITKYAFLYLKNARAIADFAKENRQYKR